MSNVIDFQNSLDRMNRAFPTEPGYRGQQMAGMGDTYSTATSYDPNGLYDEFGNLIGYAGDASTASILQTVAPSVLTSLKDLWVANRQADLQAQLLQINMVRAQQGLAPITQSMIGSLSPQVNVGLSPDTQKMLMYGGLALLAVLALNGRRR